jgi:hypothetical protein
MLGFPVSLSYQDRLLFVAEFVTDRHGDTFRYVSVAWAKFPAQQMEIG